MIDVIAREFHLKFWAYSKGVKAIRILGRGGVLIGTFYPAICDIHEQDMADESEEEPIAMQTNSDAKQNTFEDLRSKFDVRSLATFTQNGKNPISTKESFKVAMQTASKTKHAPGESMFTNEEREKEVCGKCGVLGLKMRGGMYQEYDFDLGEEFNGWVCFKCAKEKNIKLRT